MSKINTGGINVNYPTPGVNNNSQGFRTNYAAIKQNLDTAGNEITELQNKSVLKSGLTDVTLNNDMANTLISNAAIQGFRSTTFALGNNLSSTVVVDLSLGDVHYGTANANIQLQFIKWAPDGTQSNVQLIMETVNANATLSLPILQTGSQYYGTETLENYVGNIQGGYLYFPTGVDRLHYNFSTIDCGGNIEIQPLDRPRESTKVQSAVVLPITAKQGEIRFVPTSNTAGNFWGYNGSGWVRLNN